MSWLIHTVYENHAYISSTSSLISFRKFAKAQTGDTLKFVRVFEGFLIRKIRCFKL